MNMNSQIFRFTKYFLLKICVVITVITETNLMKIWIPDVYLSIFFNTHQPGYHWSDIYCPCHLLPEPSLSPLHFMIMPSAVQSTAHKEHMFSSA